MHTNTKKGLIVVAALVLLAAGFYFRSNLTDLYNLLTKNLPGIEKISPSNLINELQKQVIAPPPLRAFIEARQGSLTLAGVISQTNAHRAANGLAALKEDSKLDAAAFAKVKDMFKLQYFEHDSPSGAGPDKLADNAGYEFILIGENLALGNYTNDQVLVKAWMDSPGHRANILNKDFQEIGVAVMKGTFEGRTTWLAVQEFGVPLSACEQPSPSLKAQVDADQRELQDLAAQIETAKAELENMSRRDTTYNQKVQFYNDLVNKYNNFLTQTKSLVSQYNNQVNSFNACTNSY